MPLPILLGGAAIIAAAGGITAGIKGGVKLKQAHDSIKEDERRHQENIELLEEANLMAIQTMDDLGKLELSILQSFSIFSNLMETIQNRPEFDDRIDIDGFQIPECSPAELEKASVGAGVLLGGLGGVAAGTAGGFAAAGATTAAVMALGTASTGTAIASLSGVAATNATLAALGGGAIAAGGGGMALGSAILGGATLGVGLLIGGIIFNIAGSKISTKAEQAHQQRIEEQRKIHRICVHLEKLTICAQNYSHYLNLLKSIYDAFVEKLNHIVFSVGKTNWIAFNSNEKLLLENTCILVRILFSMCNIPLVLPQDDPDELNKINHQEIDESISRAKTILENPSFADFFN